MDLNTSINILNEGIRNISAVSSDLRHHVQILEQYKARPCHRKRHGRPCESVECLVILVELVTAARVDHLEVYGHADFTIFSPHYLHAPPSGRRLDVAVLYEGVDCALEQIEQALRQLQLGRHATVLGNGVSPVQHLHHAVNLLKVHQHEGLDIGLVYLRF